MQTISGFGRRFIPAAEFDAGLASIPVDDSGVVSVGMSDHAELQEYQRGQAAFHDAQEYPTDTDFDADFGQAIIVRQDGSDPTPKPPASAAVAFPSLKSWPDYRLISLIMLADSVGDESMLDAATGELLDRMRHPATAA